MKSRSKIGNRKGNPAYRTPSRVRIRTNRAPNFKGKSSYSQILKNTGIR